MAIDENSVTKVIFFPQTNRKIARSYRKFGPNRNKVGSVRKINGIVYVDFQYLGERIRESSGLAWNETNAKIVRDQLDRIIVDIKSGTFKFGDVFPESKRRDYLTEKERELLDDARSPDQVFLGEYLWKWYDLLKDSGRVAERTLLGYRSYIDLYLIPFLGDLAFADLNPATFDKFISWARMRKCRGKGISNETVNKIFVPLRMICQGAAIEYGWGNTYNPFFGFKKLPEGDPIEKIHPFSVEEQRQLIAEVSPHWKPYFKFAFCSGIRQGEQNALKLGDIDWSKKLLHISRAMTLDEDGKRIEGKTKNRYSRRTINLLPVMFEALKEQRDLYEQLEGEYFFCSPEGKPVNSSNLRSRVWVPALNKAGLKVREMKQTRHSFATAALSCGENPLWIAKVMGHRNTEMVIKVYSKYVEDLGVSKDGAIFNRSLEVTKGNDEEE